MQELLNACSEGSEKFTSLVDQRVKKAVAVVQKEAVADHTAGNLRNQIAKLRANKMKKEGEDKDARLAELEKEVAEAREMKAKWQAAIKHTEVKQAGGDPEVQKKLDEV